MGDTRNFQSFRKRKKFDVCFVLLIYFSTNITPTTELSVSSPSTSLFRINAKNFNKLFFNRFSLFARPPIPTTDAHYLATTIDTVDSHRNNLYNNNNNNNNFGRRNDNQQQYEPKIKLAKIIESNSTTTATTTTVATTPSTTVPTTKTTTATTSTTTTITPISLPKITTTPEPTNTNNLDNEFLLVNQTTPFSRNYHGETTTEYNSNQDEYQSTGTVVINDNHKPEMCKCVCNSGPILETYDIDFIELKRKVLQKPSVLMAKDPEVQVSDSSIENVLDSMVDPNENDYDDIDELEELQKPNKYIPMEMIELSHRRPPRKPNKTTAIASTIPPLLSKPLMLLSSSSYSSSSPVLADRNVSTILPHRSPLFYNFSFMNSVSRIKYLATRTLQIGGPLLLAAAVGNALSQVEMIDRETSSEQSDDDDVNDVNDNSVAANNNSSNLQMKYAQMFNSLQANYNSMRQQQPQQIQQRQQLLQPQQQQQQPQWQMQPYMNPYLNHNNGYYGQYYNTAMIKSNQNRRKGKKLQSFHRETKASKRNENDDNDDANDTEWTDTMAIFRRWLHQFD